MYDNNVAYVRLYYTVTLLQGRLMDFLHEGKSKKNDKNSLSLYLSLSLSLSQYLSLPDKGLPQMY